MSDRTTDQEPSRVRKLQQDGEIKARWEWVERAVWSERMLKALETGVRGGKWHSLYDKVYRPSNLEAAWGRVKANQGGGGVDKMSIAEFDKDAGARLEKLSETLRSGTYEPLPVRRRTFRSPVAQRSVLSESQRSSIASYKRRCETSSSRSSSTSSTHAAMAFGPNEEARMHWERSNTCLQADRGT